MKKKIKITYRFVKMRNSVVADTRRLTEERRNVAVYNEPPTIYLSIYLPLFILLLYYSYFNLCLWRLHVSRASEFYYYYVYFVFLVLKFYYLCYSLSSAFEYLLIAFVYNSVIVIQIIFTV